MRRQKIVLPNGQSTGEIKINAGVKQGCPLSPLLFNLVMNILVVQLEQSNLGYKLKNERVSVLAFADDLVLISESDFGMKRMLADCENFFDEKRLKANADKCLVYRQVPCTKSSNKKNVKVITEHHKWWKGEAIPVMDYENLSKYLGVKFNPRGEIIIPLEEWKGMLANLRKAPLKPEQKIKILKENVIGKWQHTLRLSDCGIGKLKEINQLVKAFYKKVLHLPVWTSDAWIYANQGGNLQDILVTILACRKKAATKLLTSNDPLVFEIGAEVERQASANFDRLKVGHISGSVKDFYQKKHLASLGEQLGNGSALATIAQSSVSRNWIWWGTQPSNIRIGCLKLMSDTFSTKINLTKGIYDQKLKMCRKCKQHPETQAHILNACQLNKDAITKRHNNVCDKVAQVLFPDEWKTHREKSFQVFERQPDGRPKAVRRIQPDIYSIEDGVLRMVEVTIPYEMSAAHLDQRLAEKTQKYALTVEQINLEEVTEIDPVAIVIGSCGTITQKCTQNLAKLGILGKAKVLQQVAMSGSVRIMKGHLVHDDG